MPFHAYAFPNRISDAAECVWPVGGREGGGRSQTIKFDVTVCAGE